MGLAAFNRARRLAAEAAAAREVEAAAEKPLEKRTKAELVELAAERGLEVPATATKAEILAILAAADDAGDGEPEGGDEPGDSDEETE